MLPVILFQIVSTFGCADLVFLHREDHSGLK